MTTTEINCDASWHQMDSTGAKESATPVRIGGEEIEKVLHGWRAAVRFPLTGWSLPAGEEVTKVEFIEYTAVEGSSANRFDVQPYDNNAQTDPCTETGADFWNHCDPATVYVNDDPTMYLRGRHRLDLGSQACIDVVAAKTAVDRFSLGIHEEGDNDGYIDMDGTGGTTAKLRITSQVVWGGSALPQVEMAKTILGLNFLPWSKRFPKLNPLKI